MIGAGRWIATLAILALGCVFASPESARGDDALKSSDNALRTVLRPAIMPEPWLSRDDRIFNLAWPEQFMPLSRLKRKKDVFAGHRFDDETNVAEDQEFYSSLRFIDVYEDAKPFAIVSTVDRTYGTFRSSPSGRYVAIEILMRHALVLGVIDLAQ